MAENENTEVHIAKMPRIEVMDEEKKDNYFKELAREMSKRFSHLLK